MKQWNNFVVDELALYPFDASILTTYRFSRSFSLFTDINPGRSLNVYVSPSVTDFYISEFTQFAQANSISIRIHSPPLEVDVLEYLSTKFYCNAWNSPFPKFDICLIGSLKEFDYVVRPSKEYPFTSLLLSRSPIVLCDTGVEPVFPTLTNRLIKDKIHIKTSRCGDVSQALQFLVENPSIAEKLHKILFSHEFSLNQLPEALQTATQSNTMKVLLTNYDH